jgi:hypothetical protein
MMSETYVLLVGEWSSASQGDHLSVHSTKAEALEALERFRAAMADETDFPVEARKVADEEVALFRLNDMGSIDPVNLS